MDMDLAIQQIFMDRYLCTLVAMIGGILVGLFSSSAFDAINGAVGILFVHDLDEKKR